MKMEMKSSVDEENSIAYLFFYDSSLDYINKDKTKDTNVKFVKNILNIDSKTKILIFIINY